MDTQVLNVIQELNRPKKSHWQAIMRTINGICIEGAISILHAFDYYGETIYYRNNRRATAEDFADEHIYPELQGRLAEETPVTWFWGGPPNKLHWYEGTLYTLLLDRILCETTANGAKHVAEWIGIDEC
jgi:hypothetical protein